MQRWCFAAAGAANKGRLYGSQGRASAFAKPARVDQATGRLKTDEPAPAWRSHLTCPRPERVQVGKRKRPDIEPDKAR